MNKFHKILSLCLAALLLLSLLSACDQTIVPPSDSTPQTQPETKDNTPENLLPGTWELVYAQTEVGSEVHIEYSRADESESDLAGIVNFGADGSLETTPVRTDGSEKQRGTWKLDGNHLELIPSSDSTLTTQTYEIVELTETELLLEILLDDSAYTFRLERR